MQLKPDADLMKVKEELSDISFGTGKIMVEVKSVNNPTIEVTSLVLQCFTEFTILVEFLLIYLYFVKSVHCKSKHLFIYSFFVCVFVGFGRRYRPVHNIRWKSSDQHKRK